jgi:hypothetical protein
MNTQRREATLDALLPEPLEDALAHDTRIKSGHKLRPITPNAETIAAMESAERREFAFTGSVEGFRTPLRGLDDFSRENDDPNSAGNESTPLIPQVSARRYIRRYTAVVLLVLVKRGVASWVTRTGVSPLTRRLPLLAGGARINQRRAALRQAQEGVGSGPMDKPMDGAPPAASACGD